MRDFDILSVARENVKRMKPYSSARDDFKGTASVFLDANENPFPQGYNRYPDPHQRQLKNVIGSLKGVNPDQIFLGNGSDEAIDLLFRVFCEPGNDSMIAPQPTYGMYAVGAEVNDVEIIKAVLTSEFDLDAQNLLTAITPTTKIIYLCSPNNPSGNLISHTEIEILLRAFNGIVVVDEAYIDFTDSPSWTNRLAEFKNLVILQTLSKAWGLAGLRLGMCFANEEIISLINKIKPPYNINTFTQAEALHTITTKRALKEKMVKEIITERENLKINLFKLSRVTHVFPSQANFLLVKVTKAKNLYDQLIEKGIVVRDRSTVILCDDCLRITVGTKEENNQLIQAISSL
ncbi:histidinol-phosphate transaminase [soil metagenome]